MQRNEAANPDFWPGQQIFRFRKLAAVQSYVRRILRDFCHEKAPVVLVFI